MWCGRLPLLDSPPEPRPHDVTPRSIVRAIAQEEMTDEVCFWLVDYKTIGNVV